MPIAGKVMPRPMGDYNASTIYDVLDIVTHDERPWICRQSNTQNITPSVINTEHWQMLFDVDVTNADTLDGFDSSYFVARNRTSEIKEVTFIATDWTTSGSTFTQTIFVTGIKSTDTPVPIFIDNGIDEASSKIKKKSYGRITEFDSEDGSITATCKYKRPDVDFTVGFKGV